MATVRPFRALRPRPENAPSVSAVPYDVVSTAEARALAEGNPLSFLHVSRSEIDLPDGTDPYSDAVYARAAENFRKLKREAPLSPEEGPSLYVYRLRMDGREQTGIAGLLLARRIRFRRHPQARADAARQGGRPHPPHDRARRADGAGLPDLPGPPEIDAIVERAKTDAPLFDFTAPDGVAHTVWRIGGQAADRLAGAFGQPRSLYIADGHHRAASAARARRELAGKNPKRTGEEAYNFFLAVAFPADQVQILPYNRVVKDLRARRPRSSSRRCASSSRSPRTPAPLRRARET